VVTLEGEAAHAGSRDALLGESAGPESLRGHSLQHLVGSTVPPLFLVHGIGDGSVPVSNSLMLFDAVQKYSKSAELHVYQTDVHGFGMLSDQGTASSWPEACERWLRQNQFIQ
jgi:acetyl esterase/lipase